MPAEVGEGRGWRMGPKTSGQSRPVLLLPLLSVTTHAQSSRIQDLVTKLRSAPGHQSHSPSYTSQRKFEVIGSGEACLSTTYHVCSIMQETPVKSEVIPYNPKPLLPDMWRPLVLTRDRHAYVIEGQVACPAPAHVIRSAFAETPLGPLAAIIPSFGEDRRDSGRQGGCC